MDAMNPNYIAYLAKREYLRHAIKQLEATGAPELLLLAPKMMTACADLHDDVALLTTCLPDDYREANAELFKDVIEYAELADAGLKSFFQSMQEKHGFTFKRNGPDVKVITSKEGMNELIAEMKAEANVIFVDEDVEDESD